MSKSTFPGVIEPGAERPVDVPRQRQPLWIDPIAQSAHALRDGSAQRTHLSHPCASSSDCFTRRRRSMALNRPHGTFILLVVVLFLCLVSAPAFAAPSPPFTQCPAIGADSGCALLIYIDSSGVPTVSGDPSQGPFDGIEDTLIGVQNDSSQPLTSMPVSATSGKQLFGFDGDGLCTFAFSGSAGCPFGTTGYEGPGTSFVNISSDLTTGVIQFSPGVPPGGHAYFSLEEALSTVPPFDLSTGVTYAALGDSYSSGEGDGGYAWNSSSATNHCDRSPSAYGPSLDALGSLGPMAFVACSGAITDDLFSPNHAGNLGTNGSPEPAQMCGAAGAAPCPAGTAPWLTPATQFVTLTIGGNDVGFADVLASCVHMAFGPLTLGPGDCLHDSKLASQVLQRLKALAGTGSAKTTSGKPIHSLRNILLAIHQAAPNAHVYLAGYPLLFPLDISEAHCKVGTIKLTNAGPISGSHDAVVSRPDQIDLNLADLVLNRVIRDAATSVGPWATYVNPIPAFADHGYCAKQSLWFNELSAQHNNKTGATTVWPGSFHPNPPGQLLGYAESFLEDGI
jgi:hypothetical protein